MKTMNGERIGRNDPVCAGGDTAQSQEPSATINTLIMCSQQFRGWGWLRGWGGDAGFHFSLIIKSGPAKS